MRLRDIVKEGSIEDVKVNLKKISNDLIAISDKVYYKNLYSIECRLLKSFAITTSEQVMLLADCIEKPIELLANICRTVFEVNVVLQYILLSRKNAEHFMLQRGADEISIYKNIKKIGDADYSSKEIQIINDHIKYLQGIFEKHDKTTKPERTSLKQMIKEVGLIDEYEALYGLYSKYIHASGWFVLGERDHIDLPGFRYIMTVQTQLYAANTYKIIDDYCKNKYKAEQNA